MITPSLITPKYCVPFLLALCLVVVALHKVGDLPSSDAKMSLFGITLCIANGKLALTQNTERFNRNLFSITSYSSTRFNMTVLDKEVVHACPKRTVWIGIALGFIGMVAFRFVRIQKKASQSF